MFTNRIMEILQSREQGKDKDGKMDWDAYVHNRSARIFELCRKEHFLESMDRLYAQAYAKCSEGDILRLEAPEPVVFARALDDISRTANLIDILNVHDVVEGIGTQSRNLERTGNVDVLYKATFLLSLANGQAPEDLKRLGLECDQLAYHLRHRLEQAPPSDRRSP